MTRGYGRHLIVLALLFAVSAAAIVGAFGPYLTWNGETPAVRFLTFFVLPITAAGIVLVVRSLQRRRGADEDAEAADAAVRGIVFWVVCFLAGVQALVLSVLLQVEWVQSWASRGVVVLVGLTLMAIGNLLPRTRPNPALGIRTARTLADRQLWMVTHRTSGYVGVAVGAATSFGGLFLAGPTIPKVTALAGLAGAAVMLASYWRFARTNSRASHP